jgi:signal peptidase I
MSDSEKPGNEHDDHATDAGDEAVDAGHDEGHAAESGDAPGEAVEAPVIAADETESVSHDADHHGDEAVFVPGAAATAAAADHEPVWAGREQVRDHDAAAKSGGAASETMEIVKTIFYALLIAFVLRVLFFQPFTIPSASMEPALYEGDYIVVSKWSYGYSRHSIPFSPPLFNGRILGSAPERGDIAVFKLPRDNRTDYIKRVIGVPGDRIQMIGGRLHINGSPVDNVEVSRGQIEDIFGPRAAIQSRETLPGGASYMIQDFGPGGDLDDTQVYEVPLGHYFMMGDNRDNSIDSRVSAASGVGLVPAENLVGKAQIILFSWTPGASLWNPVSWFANVRPSRFFTMLH